MAYVYKGLDGKKLEKVIAELPGVQAELDRQLFEAKVKAEAELKAHRHDGHSEIETEKGDIDRYLILSDDRGQKAAMSIEYGRQATETNAGMEGLFILHKAVRQKPGGLKGTGGGGK